MQLSSSSLEKQATWSRCDVQAVDDEEVFLNIDLMHMYEYDRELYNQLTAYPGEVIPLLDVEARYIAEDLVGEPLPENKLLTVSQSRAPCLRDHHSHYREWVVGLHIGTAYACVDTAWVHVGAAIQPEGSQSNQGSQPR